MTRKVTEAQINLVQRLRGQRCSQVSLGDDDELIVDFGELSQTNPGEFDGETWLIIECPWRLETSEIVRCGWDDDEDRITDAVRDLIGLTAGEPTVRRPGLDLTIPFDDGHRLRVFPDCVAYYTDDPTTLALPWYAGGKGISG